MAIDQPRLATSLLPLIWLEILHYCDLWDWVSICGRCHCLKDSQSYSPIGTSRGLREMFYHRERIINRLRLFGSRYQEDGILTDIHELFCYLRQLARISHNLLHQGHVLFDLPILPKCISFDNDDLAIRINGDLLNNGFSEVIPYSNGNGIQFWFNTAVANPVMMQVPLEDQFLTMSLGSSIQSELILPSEYEAWRPSIVQSWLKDVRGQVAHDGSNLLCLLADGRKASCIPQFTLHNNMHFQFASSFYGDRDTLKLVMWDRKSPQAIAVLDIETEELSSYSISVTLPQIPGYAWSLESISHDLHRAVLSQRRVGPDRDLEELYVHQSYNSSTVPLLLVASKYIICEVHVR